MANKTTRDHGEIRRWAEERGGKPSHVKSTGSSEDVGILRIDFPGYSGQGSLETITWEDWFDKFDERNLALLYQEETAEGQRSNFNKIVDAETAQQAETRAGHGSRGRRSGSRAKKAPIKKAAASKGAAKKGAAKKGATKKGAKRSASTKKKAAKRPTKRHVARSTSGSRGAGAKRTSSRSSRTRSAGKKTSTKKRR